MYVPYRHNCPGCGKIVPRTHVCRKPYRFVERSGDLYVWQRRIPGDSRVDQITCPVDYFWGK